MTINRIYCVYIYYLYRPIGNVNTIIIELGGTSECNYLPSFQIGSREFDYPHEKMFYLQCREGWRPLDLLRIFDPCSCAVVKPIYFPRSQSVSQLSFDVLFTFIVGHPFPQTKKAFKAANTQREINQSRRPYLEAWHYLHLIWPGSIPSYCSPTKISSDVQLVALDTRSSDDPKRSKLRSPVENIIATMIIGLLCI